MIYNFKDHIKGDSLNQVEFQLKINGVNINLTGTGIQSTFILGTQTKVMSIGNGLSFTDIVNGKFKINTQIINWDIGMWQMEVQFVFPDGRIKTYLKGQLNVIN